EERFYIQGAVEGPLGSTVVSELEVAPLAIGPAIILNPKRVVPAGRRYFVVGAVSDSSRFFGPTAILPAPERHELGVDLGIRVVHRIFLAQPGLVGDVPGARGVRGSREVPDVDARGFNSADL